MRKIIGETMGWTGLALLAGGCLYGVYQAVVEVLPFIWRVAMSGDIGAIAWLGTVVGLVLLFVGVSVTPSEKAAE